jgi:hypothetical protein
MILKTSVLERTQQCVRLWIWDVRRTSGTGFWILETELLKLQKNGQFPDESVKRKDTQIHYVNTQTY